MSLTPSSINNYWFTERSKQYWFSSTPEIDDEIRLNYEKLWEKGASGELIDWRDSAEGCLALTILFDQLPLNMFRGQAKGFQTENMAVVTSLHAINCSYDEELNNEQRLFLFMPLMHSENLDHQNLQVYLFQKYNFNLEFSEHHRSLVKKFGRFPHRNEILGRMSTMEEIDYLLSDNAFKG